MGGTNADLLPQVGFRGVERIDNPDFERSAGGVVEQFNPRRIHLLHAALKGRGSDDAARLEFEGEVFER